ncbi:hypothetical protein KAT72_08760 [Aeromonas popoffii]|uniref:Uncharacterized protein n=1 Tax=Aeromonas popoffii TaxID=70856 RepID=A0ABS5GPS9_9GAMM|nr:hypothetical protein [Aeromonas popoffii]
MASGQLSVLSVDLIGRYFYRTGGKTDDKMLTNKVMALWVKRPELANDSVFI